MSAALRKKDKGEDMVPAPPAATPPPIPMATPTATPAEPGDETAPVAKPSKPEKTKKEKKQKEDKAKKEEKPKEKGSKKKTLILLLLVVVLGGVAAFMNLGGARLLGQAGEESTGEDPEGVETQKTTAPAVKKDVPMVLKRVKRGEASWLFAKQRLNVTATMRGSDGQMLAVVNGNLLKVGDKVEAEYEGTTYYWRLSAIENKTAKWQPIKSIAMVPAE